MKFKTDFIKVRNEIYKCYFDINKLIVITYEIKSKQ